MAENDTPAAASQQPTPTPATPLQQLPRTIPPVPTSEFGGETNAESADPSIQAEEQLLNRIMDRLQQMGVTQASGHNVLPAQPVRQEAPVQQANGPNGTSTEWDQGWHQQPWSSWDDQWTDWKEEDKGSKGWKEDDRWDRPYLSHLDFPKFGGR